MKESESEWTDAEDKTVESVGKKTDTCVNPNAIANHGEGCRER